MRLARHLLSAFVCLASACGAEPREPEREEEVHVAAAPVQASACDSAASCVQRRIEVMNAQAALLERVTDEATARAIAYDLALSYRELRAVADVIETLAATDVAAAEATARVQMDAAVERMGRAHGRASLIEAAQPILVSAMPVSVDDARR